MLILTKSEQFFYLMLKHKVQHSPSTPLRMTPAYTEYKLNSKVILSLFLERYFRLFFRLVLLKRVYLNYN